MTIDIHSHYSNHPFLSEALRASAGSGKTHELTGRYLEMLFAGIGPEKILAITFSRKAAREIAERVLERLDELVAGTDPLAERLAGTLGVSPEEVARRAAALRRQLRADISRLHISTIDSFFTGLVRQMPRESGLRPEVRVIEERQQRRLEDEAVESFLSAAAQDPRRRRQVLRFLDLARGNALRPRDVLHSQFKAFSSRAFVLSDLVAEFAATGFEPLEEELEAAQAACGDPAFVADLHQLADRLMDHVQYHTRDGKPNQKLVGFVDKLRRYSPTIAQGFLKDVSPFQREDPAGINYLANFLRYARDDGREDLAEEIEGRLIRCRDGLLLRLGRLLKARARFQAAVWLAVGEGIRREYQAIKERENVVDFADLEDCSRFLATLRSEGRLDYFYFRLDSRIEHILLDEFQDTSAGQWEVIRPLVEEIMSGEGGGEGPRSFFYVGDPKQAIYRFRGGHADLFDQVLEAFPALEERDLPYSYRSGEILVQWVNDLFSDQFRPYTPQQIPPERPERLGAGFVRAEWFPTRRGEEAEDGDPVIDGVREWLLRFHEEAAVPWSGMAILARQNSLLADVETMLAGEGIPFVSEGRNLLLESPGGRDLLSVLRFLERSNDMRLLCEVMRGPVFRYDYGRLMALHEREGVPLHRLAAIDPDAAGKLEDLLDLVGFMTLPELVQQVCLRLDLPGRYDDPGPLLQVQEEAQAFAAENRPATLAAFLDDLDRNADLITLRGGSGAEGVRLMTVHKAKGLDFHTVVVADRKTPMGLSASKTSYLFHYDPLTGKADAVMPYVPKELHAAIPEAKDLTDKEDRQCYQDELNALYVALTRAKANLVFLTFDPASRGGTWTWSRLVRERFESEVIPADDRRVMSRGDMVKAEVAAVPTEAIEMRYVETRGEKVPESRLVSPSRIGHEGAESGGDLQARYAGMLTGLIVHGAMELSPGRPRPADIESLAHRALARVPVLVNRDVRAACLRRAGAALRVLATDGDLEALFRHPSQAEVPLALSRGDQMVMAQVDRIFLAPDRLMVLDFKTDTIDDPQRIADLVGNYRDQVTAYMDALTEIHPDRRVEGYLFFTDAPAGSRLQPV